MGSILIRKFKSQEVSGNIGQFQVDKAYPAQSQLIHTLTFSLESIAWAHGTSYVVINPGDVYNATDVVRELEFTKISRPNKQMFYLKYRAQ